MQYGILYKVTENEFCNMHKLLKMRKMAVDIFAAL